jgi:hypothetical protein
LAIQTNEGQQLNGFAARSGSAPTFAAITEANQHILQGSKTEERPDELESSGQAVAANPMRRQPVHALAAKSNLT